MDSPVCSLGQGFVGHEVLELRPPTVLHIILRCTHSGSLSLKRISGDYGTAYIATTLGCSIRLQTFLHGVYEVEKVASADRPQVSGF